MSTTLHNEEVTNFFGVSFENVSYTSSVTKHKLLDNISGFCSKGSMVALMGQSGAGKSTLLDIIAGRKKRGFVTGSVMARFKDGSINLRGENKRYHSVPFSDRIFTNEIPNEEDASYKTSRVVTFRRLSSYVVQNDKSFLELLSTFFFFPIFFF